MLGIRVVLSSFFFRFLGFFIWYLSVKDDVNIVRGGDKDVVFSIGFIYSGYFIVCIEIVIVGYVGWFGFFFGFSGW